MGIYKNKKEYKMQAEKITSVKCLGFKQTYDIEIDSDDHIFWGNGIATSNSHAYSYATNAYYSAYCKKHIPMDFYRVYLNHAGRKPDPLKEIKELVNDARLHSIKILSPSLKHLYENFTIVNENEIVYGYGHIKDVGKTDIVKIEQIKKKIGDNLENLTWIELLLAFKKVGQKAVKALISSGAFSGAYNNVSRNKMLYEYDTFKELNDSEITFIEANLNTNEDLLHHIVLLLNQGKVNSRRLPNLVSLQNALSNTMYEVEDAGAWIAKKERFYLGVPLSITNNFDSEDLAAVDTNCIDILTGNVKGPATLSVTILEVKEHKIKAGKSAGEVMSFLSVEDCTGALNSVVLFPKEYKSFKHILIENNDVIIAGNVNMRNGEYSLIGNNVIQI